MKMPTNEQLAIISKCLREIQAAADPMRAIMRELGWTNFDHCHEIGETTEFNYRVWDMLEAMSCPGHDILTAEECADYIDVELRDRALVGATE